ncbi:hypothetical protein HDV05_006841 [Chytridiales sp. JEL 0842]|nr:hypothetical protein HDV05_006841 [Chytridiales sp. JEL 0842]
MMLSNNMLSNIVTLLLSTFLLVASLAAAAASPADSILNLNAVRHLDLTAGGIVREKTVIVFQAKDDSKEDVKEYAVAASQLPNQAQLAFLKVVEKRDRKVKGPGVELKMVGKVAKSESKLESFRYKLAKPLKAGEKSSVELYAVYTNATSPYPKVVSQTSKQLVEFFWNGYMDSVYQTEKQKTTIKLPTANVLSEGENIPEPFSRSGPTANYGPYTNVAPGTFATVYLHYEDPKAILVAKSLSREMEVSHWGSNLATTEYWDLHHRGAKIRNNDFSRIDYQLSVYSHHQTNVVKDLKVILPPKATHVYYRDDIGNVSTSNFYQTPKHSILHIRPRYPLFGGWRYSWHHSYDVPLGGFVKKNKKSGRYVLQVPFAGSVANVTVENVVFKMVLPEGATDVKVALPFKVDKETHTVSYSNLDTVGRPTVILEKSNVVDEHGLPVQISYNLDTAALIRKPLAVSAIIFGLLVLGMIANRLDLTLVHDPRKEKINLERSKLVKDYLKLTHTFHLLTEAFDKYRASQDLSTFKSQRSTLEGQILSHLDHFANVSKTTKEVDAKFAASVGSLEKAGREKLGKLKVWFDEVVAFLTESVGGGVDEKKKEALMVKLAGLEKGVKELESRMEGLVETM